jgi:apolipoprotein N-acyltransferase
VLTAGLLWLSYFPVAWGWLGWVALVPFLALVRLRCRFRYLSAYAGGLIFFTPALQWMRVADGRMYVTWIALAVYCALYFPFALYFLRRLDRIPGLPLTLSLPVVWTAVEWVRSTFITGFGWYMLGHTQHDFLPVIQISDITGAYGVTFLVAAVNGLVFEILWRWSRQRRGAGVEEVVQPRWSLAVQAVGVVGLLAGTLAYGWYRLGQDHFRAGPRVALVQGNLDQRLRIQAMLEGDATRKAMDHYVLLCDAAEASYPDLIVWPETSSPYPWDEEPDGKLLPWTKTLAETLAERWHTHVLLGVNGSTLVAGKHPRRRNSAVLIDPKGRPLGRYDKMHLVVFGEYVPLRDWLPFMEKLAPYDFDYSVWPGESFTRFPLAKGQEEFHFGVVICFEDTDPDLSRPYAGGDGKPAVDFLLNISNDGWFDGTSEHDEHLAICRFRAVECRRAVGRSVNMGISALIDSNGRVLAPQSLVLSQQTLPVEPNGRLEAIPVWTVEAVAGAPGLPLSRWGEFKKVPGVLLATIPLDDRPSLYARWGDWLALGCGGLCLAAVVGVYLRRMFKRSNEDDVRAPLRGAAKQSAM